jgi:2-polyprenyl-3-methyl-5-hydroxy-6-metoxy-1,4-benzoquinol methylase
MNYRDKPADYFGHSRTDALRLLVGSRGLSILELGAGGGFTLVEAKRCGIASYVAGVELHSVENGLQQHPCLDEFHHSDLNGPVAALRRHEFDVLLCLDVLEHLVDPWTTLSAWSVYLKKDGLLIISVPNFREFKVIWKVFFRGDFGYTAAGILDKGHLRFFTRKTVMQLASPVDFNSVRVVSAIRYQQPGAIRKWVDALTFGLLEDFLTVQWFMTAKKS